ncbi:MAG TPA: hypothetical protein VJB57_08615 [Dehalococcoidia bacterium]|nr:hypothetical protein [Dehalococcoidia bacterium]
MKWFAAAVLGFVLAFLPALAFADNGDKADDVLVRIRGDVVIASGERVGSVVVIDGDAVIDGEVDESVTVINGNAIVSGKVGGNLTVISGDIDLKTAARVNNVFSIRGDLVRAEGATVTGEIRERDNFEIAAGIAAVFSLLFWLGMSVAVVAAGLVFAAVGGHQLKRSAETMTGDAVGVLVGVVFVWVAIPVVAGVAMATLIGIPLGIGLLLFLLPALWFLGYIVAGARLGGALVGLTGRTAGEHPYAATTVGLVLLQLAVLIPVLGALVALFAGIWGAGAIAIGAYRAAGGRGFAPTPTTPAPQPPTPAQEVTA